MDMLSSRMAAIPGPGRPLHAVAPMRAAEPEPIRVALAASAIVGWALQQLLESAQRLAWVDTLADLRDVPDDLGMRADVLVAEFDDPDAIGRLVQLVSTAGLHVIVLTGLRDTAVLDPAILAGLRGVVRKSDPPDTLLQAVECVHRGELWLDSGATSRMLMHVVRRKAARRDDPDGMRIASLTAREREAIAALVADTSVPAKVIADRLSISSHTLRNHLTAVYRKLQVNNRLDLYAYASRHNLGGSERSRA